MGELEQETGIHIFELTDPVKKNASQDVAKTKSGGIYTGKKEDPELKSTEDKVTRNPVVGGDQKETSMSDSYELTIELIGTKGGPEDEGRTRSLVDKLKEEPQVTILKNVLNDFNLEVLSLKKGCVELTVRVKSLDDLQKFWEACKSGIFQERIKGTLPVEEVKFSEDVYQKGCQFFEDAERQKEKGGQDQGKKAQQDVGTEVQDKDEKTGLEDDHQDKEETAHEATGAQGELKKTFGVTLLHGPSPQVASFADQCRTEHNEGERMQVTKPDGDRVQEVGGDSQQSTATSKAVPPIKINSGVIVFGDVKDSTINFNNCYEFSCKLIECKEEQKDKGQAHHLDDIVTDETQVVPLKNVLKEYNIELLAVKKGCVQIIVRVKSREDLEKFWEAHTSGIFQARIKSVLPVAEVRILEDVYQKGCQFFEDAEKQNEKEDNVRRGPESEGKDGTMGQEEKRKEGSQDKEKTREKGVGPESNGRQQGKKAQEGTAPEVLTKDEKTGHEGLTPEDVDLDREKTVQAEVPDADSGEKQESVEEETRSEGDGKNKEKTKIAPADGSVSDKGQTTQKDQRLDSNWQDKEDEIGQKNIETEEGQQKEYLSFTGTRVVRGPDWKWGDQDGGYGCVGTVVPVQGAESKSSVWVRWDSGVLGKYRSGTKGGKFILRIYDNAQRGVKHTSVACNCCYKRGLEGIRWKCLRCDDYDLCHSCYNKCKHDLDHPFVRKDEPDVPGVEVPCRSQATKCTVYGIFPGARVVRGPDWKWANQDGGVGNIGTVTDFHDSERSWVKVQWSDGDFNVYRCGSEGKMDLQYTERASNGNFFIEHFPTLDVSKCGTRFAIGDKVCLKDIDLNQLKDLQEKSCGWREEMINLKGRIGKVKEIDSDGDVLVKFGSSIYYFNPGCLRGKAPAVYIKKTGKEDEVGNELFIKAALGDTNEVISIIRNHPDAVHYQNEHGITPLHAASNLGHIDSVIALVEGNAPLEQPDEDENTPLIVAVTGEHPNVVKYLLLAGSNPNASDENGLTPLHIAVGIGNKTCAEVLLCFDQKRSDVNSQDIDGDTPLFIAIGLPGDNEAMIDLLIGHTTDDGLRLKNHRGFNALHYAALKGKKFVVEKLLKVSPSIINIAKEDGFTALHIAAINGYAEVVKILLKQKTCNIGALTAVGQTALDLAVEGDYYECVQILMDHGAMASEDDSKPTPDNKSEGGKNIRQGRNILDIDIYPKSPMKEIIRKKESAQAHTETDEACKV